MTEIIPLASGPLTERPCERPRPLTGRCVDLVRTHTLGKLVVTM
ncbi:hypothetical protein ACIRL0_12295 [Streptomyces sp. NPDC102365]